MICNIFKPKRKINGKTIKSRMYRGRFRLDGDYSITEVSLKTPDKKIADKRLNDIIIEKQKEREGIIPSKAIRKSANKPLIDHLNDFIDDLIALRRTKKHIDLTNARISKLLLD